MFALARLTRPVSTREGAVKGDRSTVGGEREGEGSGGDTLPKRGEVSRTISIVFPISRVSYVEGVTPETLLAIISALLALCLALSILVIPHILALPYTLKGLRKYAFDTALIC